MMMQKRRDVTDHQIARIDQRFKCFGVFNVNLTKGASLKTFPLCHLPGRFKMVATDVNKVLLREIDTLGFLRRRLTMVSVMSPDPKTKMFLTFDFYIIEFLLYSAL